MSAKKHILITGANGQLGNEFRVLSRSADDYDFTFVKREELSIDDLNAVEKYFSQHKFDFCINCAAYTAVDKAESEPDAAYNINALAVENLALLCRKNETRFIHISTDYVFDGSNSNGYKEDDNTGPLSIYGSTKLAGEQKALSANPESIIIRTSWVYSSFGKNFVKTMMRLMSEKESISVVNDQTGSPTYAADLAQAIFDIIHKNENPVSGVYHYSNKGVITWYEFALEIKRLGNYLCMVNPIPTSEYPTPATRPKYSILKTEKIETTFGIAIPEWKDSLKKCFSLLQI